MQVRKEMSFNKKKEDNRVIKHIHSKKNFSPPCEKCNKKIKEGVQDGKDSISTVLSSDEGYIVFSFREDGAFDIVIDCNAAAKSESFTTVVDGKNQNSRPVIRKVYPTQLLPFIIFSSNIFFLNVLSRIRYWYWYCTHTLMIHTIKTKLTQF